MPRIVRRVFPEWGRPLALALALGWCTVAGGRARVPRVQVARPRGAGLARVFRVLVHPEAVDGAERLVPVRLQHMSGALPGEGGWPVGAIRADAKQFCVCVVCSHLRPRKRVFSDPDFKVRGPALCAYLPLAVSVLTAVHGLRAARRRGGVAGAGTKTRARERGSRAREGAAVPPCGLEDGGSRGGRGGEGRARCRGRGSTARPS